MPIMKNAGAFLCCALAAIGLCRAQSPASTSVELDLDSRARIAAVGQSGAKLQTSGLRLVTSLAPGLKLKTYATHQYGYDAVQQAVVEKEWGSNRVQAGLVRLPFGIYDTRETYASGLIDYAMPRGDYAYHSVDWGVPGVSWEGGSPKLQIEAAGFGGKSSSIWNTQNNIHGGAMRLQTYAGGLILGASRWDGSFQVLPKTPGDRPVHMNGLDMRYTRPHLLLRGEYLFGTMAGDHETGWYVDAYYHLPALSQWTLTGRLEQLKAASDYPMAHQVTLGVRYVASPQWTLVVNWRRNNAASYYKPTWTSYAGKSGDIFLQAYRKFND